MIRGIRKNSCSLLCYGFLLILSFTANKAIFAATGDIANFLSISDIHFDPFSECENTAPCSIIEALNRSPARQWKTLLVEQARIEPVYGKNTSFKLLESALSAFKQVATSSTPRFVLVLGDLLPHDYQENFARYSNDKTDAAYQVFVKKTMEFLADELNAAFPTTKVYYVVGNHDTYRNNFSSDANGMFFKDMAEVWSRLLKDKKAQAMMQKTFQAAGYYATDLPQQSNFRLIVLNSVLFSTDANGENIDIAAEEELNWLHEELNVAQAKQQHVLIALHVPPGVNLDASIRSQPFQTIGFWKPTPTSRFLAELHDHAADVSAVLAGHYHLDWFQVYTSNDGQLIPIVGTPAVSSILGNNPAFKRFSYDTESLQLENFFTYVYSFETKAWSEEYNFNTIHQPNCKNCAVIDAMNSLQPTDDRAEYYKQFLATGHLMPLINQIWLPYLWCDIRAITVQDYQICLAAHQSDA